MVTLLLEKIDDAMPNSAFWFVSMSLVPSRVTAPSLGVILTFFTRTRAAQGSTHLLPSPSSSKEMTGALRGSGYPPRGTGGCARRKRTRGSGVAEVANCLPVNRRKAGPVELAREILLAPIPSLPTRCSGSTVVRCVSAAMNGAGLFPRRDPDRRRHMGRGEDPGKTRQVGNVSP